MKILRQLGWIKKHKFQNSKVHIWLTLTIPLTENVRLDVLDTNRNSLNSRQKANMAPANTSASFVARSFMSVERNRASMEDIFIPIQIFKKKQVGKDLDLVVVEGNTYSCNKQMSITMMYIRHREKLDWLSYNGNLLQIYFISTNLLCII